MQSPVDHYISCFEDPVLGCLSSWKVYASPSAPPPPPELGALIQWTSIVMLMLYWICKCLVTIWKWIITWEFCWNKPTAIVISIKMRRRQAIKIKSCIVFYLCIFQGGHLHVHSTKKVGSRLTLFDITREIFYQACSLMHAEFSYAHFEWLFIVHTDHYWEITEFMKSGARKIVALFVSRPMALKCMALKYRHKNSMHTLERLVAPLNKLPLFSKHPAQQNWCFDCENNDKLQRMTSQNVRMHYILNEQFWLNISRVISKHFWQELTFLVECIIQSSSVNQLFPLFSGIFI